MRNGFRHIRELRRSDDGTILAIWGVSFVALFGIVAMSFDMGRIGITQTELQSFADHVALAAAGELDGGSDAITRAEAAAANLVSDFQTFGNANNTLAGATDYTLVFLTDLPASDASAMTAVTTDPEDAQFVRVIVNNATVNLTFGAAFSALSGNAGPNNVVSASAVAGYDRYVCDSVPIFFCLPTTPLAPGNMINLRSGGGGGAHWGPGNYGFLDQNFLSADPDGACAGKSGGPLMRCLLGATGTITQCYKSGGIDTEPGQKNGITGVSINTRFDIYSGSMQGEKNNADYAPAPNVIKGIVPKGGGSCIGNNVDPSPDTAGLPRDDCFATGTCGGNGRFGDGTWTSGRINYVNMNYGGVDPHPTATTRWQYYLAEIAAAGGGGSTNAILPPGLSETGRRMCSNNQTADPDRRTFTVAAVNCTANPVTGSETGVPVEGYYKVFLTEPVGNDGGSPPTVDIWGEVIEIIGAGVGGGAGGVFRDVVQLYR